MEMIELRQGFIKEEFNEMLHVAYKAGVSDISIQTNSPIIFHLYGSHIPVTKRNLLHNEVGSLCSLLYGGDNAIAMLAGGRDLDPRYEFLVERGKKIGFRVNITQCRVNGEQNGYAVTMRSLPQKPRLLEELKRPAEISESMFQKQGLVLVVGATGSGKSTLLAGGIRELLEIHRDHKILTYEKPIEYTYDTVEKHESNLIYQHEMGQHLKEFPDGVRNALRRAPTVILIGESRDKETIEATIEATLTGHATYTTVHAETVGGALSRMIQSFEHSAHGSISEKLISILRLVVVQRLCKNKTGDGRVALNEWLPLGKAEKKILSKVKPEDLSPFLDNMVYERGTSMAHHAAYEYSRGNITIEAASGASGVSPNDIEKLTKEINPLLFETRTEKRERMIRDGIHFEEKSYEGGH